MSDNAGGHSSIVGLSIPTTVKRQPSAKEPLPMDWSDWWCWEIEITPRLLKRMVDRRFNELDLRLMMDSATGFHDDQEQGRLSSKRPTTKGARR